MSQDFKTLKKRMSQDFKTLKEPMSQDFKTLKEQMSQDFKTLTTETRSHRERCKSRFLKNTYEYEDSIT